MRFTRCISAVLIAGSAACGAGTATIRTGPAATPSPSPAPASESPFVVTADPDPVQHGQEAVITIRGRAFGGRHLSVASFQVEGLGGWNSSPGCAADPSHEPALPDDPVELAVPYTWKDPGTYPVTMEVVAHCRMGDIPPHTVTAEITVE